MIAECGSFKRYKGIREPKRPCCIACWKKFLGLDESHLAVANGWRERAGVDPLTLDQLVELVARIDGGGRAAVLRALRRNA